MANALPVPSNKGMKLTRLSAAPGGVGGAASCALSQKRRTALQLIPDVRQTHGGHGQKERATDVGWQRRATAASPYSTGIARLAGVARRNGQTTMVTSGVRAAIASSWRFNVWCCQRTVRSNGGLPRRLHGGVANGSWASGPLANGACPTKPSHGAGVERTSCCRTKG